jgi:hypothetical protein
VIPRVRPRSADVREVLRDLLGPGEHGEHRDHRLVAAWAAASVGGVAGRLASLLTGGPVLSTVVLVVGVLAHHAGRPLAVIDVRRP